MQTPPRKPTSLGRAIFLVGLFLTPSAIIAYLVVGALVEAERNRPQVYCDMKLRDVGRALADYHEQMGHFPPQQVIDMSGQPAQGWRVLALQAWKDNNGFYSGYDPNLPWNAAANLAAAKSMFQDPFVPCPASDYVENGLTHYTAVADTGFLFDGTKTVARRDVTDGLAETIAVIEAAGTGILWSEPRDLTWDEFLRRFQAQQLSPHDGGFNVLFADGHLEFLKYDTDPAQLRAMFTIAGGEDLAGRGGAKP